MVKHRHQLPAADLDGELIPDGATAEERRHAVWGLAVLAMLAILIVTIMAFVIGPSGGHKQHIGLFFPTDSTQPSPTDQSSVSPNFSTSASGHPSAQLRHSSAAPSPSSTHPTTQATTTSPSPTPSSTHPTTPHSSTAPAPGGTALEGDGELIAYINAYRQNRGLAPLALGSGYSPALAKCTANASAPGQNCTPNDTEGVTTAFSGLEARNVLLQQRPKPDFFTSSSSTITCEVGWSYHAAWSVPYYFAVICN